MFRFVPPAGSPLRIKQVLDCVRAALPPSGHAEEHLRTIAGRLRVKHVFGMSSGRGALWLALRSLYRLRPDRDVVAVPAYTCFSVPAAIVRAGLKIYPVEVDPRTLDFDPASIAALPEKRLLCIIPCNLFGFPNDISVVRKAAVQRGGYVVDDAAQALGSTRHGQRVGARGDVGIYSLGRGKSVGSLGGGLLVTDSDEIAAAIRSESAALVDAGATNGGALLLKMFAYSLLLNPRLFWIPNSLPFLKLGATEFEPSFPAGGMHPLSSALLGPLLDELDEINRVRRENAKAMTDGMCGSSIFAFPTAGAGSRPTFVRLPVFTRDQATRDRAVALLRDAGIGATAFYPSAICDIPGIDKHMSERNLHCTQAEQLSERLFTLPAHPFVQARDIERILEILNSLQGKHRFGMTVGASPDELKPDLTIASPCADKKSAGSGSGPRVSVIIPTYNAAEMVGEAIESVLAQTYSDFEIVVIDDGSTDHTEGTVRRFGDRVRYFKQENRGVSAARNAGIERSLGQYIAFLDSDDLWWPEKLAEEIPLFDADPKLGLVYCDWAVASGESVLQSSYHKDLRPARGYVFDELVQRGFILTSGVVVRRECLSDVGNFDKSLSVAEDYDLWLRISYRWKVGLVDKCLFTKRRWNGSLSSRLTETAANRIVLFRRILSNLPDLTPPRRRLVRHQVSLSYWDLGYDHFDRLSFPEARKNFRSSLLYDWTNVKALGYLTASCLPISLVRAVRTVKRAHA
jgi:perosamine synthetase